MTSGSSPIARPEWAEPCAALPVVEGDDGGWLLTFSDLVLQLFAFVLVVAVCGGATRVPTPPVADAAPRVDTAAPVDAAARASVAAPAAAAPESSKDGSADHALAALAPASVWAADRADLPPVAEIARAATAPVSDPPANADAAPLAESVAAAQNDAIAAARPRDAARVARLRALGGYLSAFVAARGDGDEAMVTAGDGEVRLAFGGRLGFNPGSAELLPQGKSLLREVQRIASGVPDVAIQVAGYTDDVPIHSREFPSNLELSLARAARVARELERDDPGLAVRTVALGFGPHHAVAPNDGPENRARNRRVEVRLVDRDQSMP